MNTEEVAQRLGITKQALTKGIRRDKLPTSCVRLSDGSYDIAWPQAAVEWAANHNPGRRKPPSLPQENSGALGEGSGSPLIGESREDALRRLAITNADKAAFEFNLLKSKVQRGDLVPFADVQFAAERDWIHRRTHLADNLPLVIARLFGLSARADYVRILKAIEPVIEAQPYDMLKVLAERVSRGIAERLSLETPDPQPTGEAHHE